MLEMNHGIPQVELVRELTSKVSLEAFCALVGLAWAFTTTLALSDTFLISCMQKLMFYI